MVSIVTFLLAFLRIPRLVLWAGPWLLTIHVAAAYTSSKPNTNDESLLKKNKAQSSVIIWQENFNQVDGTDADTRWTLASTQNTTQVQSGRLVSTNDEATWTSEVISINGPDTKVSVDIESTPNMETNDYLAVYYKLDGGPEIPLLNGLWIGSIERTSAKIGELNGSSVQIVIKCKSDESGEQFFIDNVRVYTEPNERYAIQNGNWNDPATWSYTSGGAPCNCVPDPLSDTYIDNGNTVSLNQHGSTQHLTVSGNSKLQWTRDSRDLRFWGDAILQVAANGEINRGATADPNAPFFTLITFNKWNARTLDNDQIRTLAADPTLNTVNVLIEIEKTNGLLVSSLRFNAVGNYTMQGAGSITTASDLEINHQAEVTNNLANLLIEDDLNLDFPTAKFINTTNLVISDQLKYKQSNTAFINSGNIETNTLILSAAATSNSTLTTSVGSSFKVNNTTDLNNNEFIVHNNATVDMAGDLVQVVPGKALFYNHSGATWYFGGNVDNDVYLFTAEPGNTVDYNSSEFQVLLAPRDADNFAQIGSYWHLLASNKNTNENSPSTVYKRITSEDLDINGNFSIIGTQAGKVIIAGGSNRDLFVAGDWIRQETNYAIFGEGEYDETVVFDGFTDQLIVGEETFLNLAVDKDVGKLSLVDQVQVDQGFHFRKGIVEINGAPLTFKSAARVATVSDASHGRGKVSKLFLFNEVAASSSYTIDIYAAGTSNNETMELYLDGALVETWANVGGDAHNGLFQQYTHNLSGELGRIEVRFANDDTNRDLRVDRIEINGVPFQAEDAESIYDLRENECNAVGSEWLLCIGRFRWNFSTSPAYTQFVFPVGDGTYYRPAGLSEISTSANFTAEYFSTNPNDDTYSTSSTAPELAGYEVSACEYWQITRDNGTASAKLTLSWGDNSCPVNPEDVVIVRWDGGQWVPIAGSSAVDVTAQQVTSAIPIDAFGIFTLATTITDLPNTAPVANTDTYVVDEDAILKQDVSTNDRDADRDALSFKIDPAGLPMHGRITLNPDGTFTYAPEENYFGNDQFIYQVCDDGNPSLCDTAKVSILITPVNDAPTALADTFTIAENEFLQENLLGNDYDVDGDLLVNTTVVTLPQNGTVDIGADGRFTYQPFNNYTGEDTFSYQVCDNQDPALCTEATVTVLIRPGLLSVPKGFSPNGDNSYDEWIIGGIRGYTNNTVSIFNRWGSVVFKAQGYNNTEVVWNGNSSGNGLRAGGPQLPDGVYFYVIDLGEGQPPLSGFLVLKR